MEQRIARLTIACFFVVPLFLCLFPIVDHDIGFHLKAGEWIWSCGQIPAADPFSYTAAGRPWIDSHWGIGNTSCVFGTSDNQGS